MNLFRKVYIPLYIATLIPMFGVLFAKWSVAGYLFSYWVETYIISLAVICHYFLEVITGERDRGMRRAVTHLLVGFMAVSAVLLAVLALLLKSISWKMWPGESIPLVDLFQLFLSHITQYNFFLYAVLPVCINVAIHIGQYIFNNAYRKSSLAGEVFADLGVRFILQGFIIVWVALYTEAKQMAMMFFVLKVLVEVVLREEELEVLSGNDGGGGVYKFGGARWPGLRGKRGTK